MPGRRKTGKPQRRFMDEVNEDVQRVGVTKENRGGIKIIHCKRQAKTIKRRLFPVNTYTTLYSVRLQTSN